MKRRMNMHFRLLGVFSIMVFAICVKPQKAFSDEVFTSTAPPQGFSSNTPPVSSSIIVPSGTGTITDLDVSTYITHSYIADNIVYLNHAESGLSLTLFAYGCGGSDNIIGVFDDEAGIDVCTSGHNNPAVHFTPGNPLSLFDGINPAGTWTLTVDDNAMWDSGTFYSWGLSITGFSLVYDLVVSALESPFSSPHDLSGGAETYDNVTLLDGLIEDTVGGGLLTSNNGFEVQSGTISANLAGGTLTKTTSGLVSLSGTNTYTGGTFLNEGTLSVGSDNNLGDAAGALSFDGGTLQITGTDFTSTARTINWGTSGGGFDIADANNTFTVSQALSGDGGLTKSGDGILTLSGTNDYSGLTTVDAGTLVVNGSLAGDVQNNVLGKLMGNGTIGGTVTNDGIIAPGNSIGILPVGDYVSNTGSSYEVELDDSGASDLISATGMATLNGGTVDVLAAGASTDYGRQTTYTIVSADSGVTGTYEGVTINLAELSPTLLYDDPNLVELLLTRTDIDFGALSGNLTHNQKSVAGILTTASLTTTSGDFSDVLNLYVDDLTEAERPAALDEMGGQKIHTTMPMVAFGLIESFQGAVGGRMSRLHQANDGAMAKADPLDGVKLAMAGDVTDLGPLDKQGKKDRNFWAHAYAINGDVDASQNAAGYDFDVYGAAFGLDFPVAKGTNLGFTAGYGTGNVGTDRHDDADIDSVLVGIYGNYEKGRFYLDGMVAYADNSYETDRNITVGPLTRKAEGDYEGSEWAFAAEMGYVGTVGDYTVQPFLGTRFIRLDEDGFTEKGAGDLNLTVDDRTAYSWKVYPGVKVNRAMKIGEKSLFVPEVSVKFMSELRDSYDTVNASFVGAPASGSFSVDGIDIAKNSIELGAGFKVLKGNNFQVGLDFGTEINSERTSYLWNVGVKFLW